MAVDKPKTKLDFVTSENLAILGGHEVSPTKHDRTSYEKVVLYDLINCKIHARNLTSHELHIILET